MVELATTIWADGPSSTPYEPHKHQIRSWGTWIENTLSALGFGLTAVYVRGSLTQLVAVTGAQAGEVGIVVADDNEALRGIYVYSGSLWQKKLDLPVDAATILLQQTENARDLALEYRNQTRDARDAASNFRDQAAGYVNDIASEKEVPIYGTASGMTAIGVPSGILTINVLGRSAIMDSPTSTWGRVASEPDVAANLKFRTTDRFLPNGSTSSADGGWWQYQSTRPVLDQFRGEWTPQSLLSFIQARLAAGEALKLAAYGDSTTDGESTTGYTANPVDGSGRPVGNTDHASTAPNAWPAKLQTTLQAMYTGLTRLWNAGYSGRSIADGWAYANYERAVINNPQYGIPDVCFVAFGLNDINPVGSQLAAHTLQTRRLLLKIMAYGTIPVLLTCDPIWRNDAAERDHKEAERQINAAKHAIAAEFRIPIIDVSEAMKKWMSVNMDGYAWATEQTDGLHFGDNGHAFKAGLIAKELFRDAVVLKGKEWRRVESFDSAAAFSANWSTQILTSSFSEQGGNVSINSGAPSNQVMMSLWVWNEDPDAELIYRGIDEERYLAADFTTAPYIRNYFNLTGNGENKHPAGVGFEITANSYHRSDMPYRFGHMPYGLSLVRYISGDGGALRHGFFEFWSTPRTTKRHNALKNSGHFSVNFPASPAQQAVLLPEQKDGSNVFGLMEADKVDILTDVTLPVGSGFVFAHCRAWGTGITNGSRNFSMLYRSAANEVRIYPGYVLADGTVSFGTVIATGTLAATTDDQKFRIRIYRETNTQKVEVYQQLDGGTAFLAPSIPRTGAYPVHWAGAVGGFFRNNGASGAGSGIAVCRMLSVVRS